MQNPREHPTAPTWKFSLRSLVFSLALISFILAWFAWFRWVWSDYGFYAYYPGTLGLASIGLLLLATFQTSWPELFSSVLNIIAVAWLITFANVLNGCVKSFTVVSITSPNPTDLAKMTEEGVYLAIVSAVTLPLFCTLPAIYLLIVRGQLPRL